MMSHTMRLCLMFVFAMGCEAPEKRGLPPDPSDSLTDTADDGDSSSSTAAVHEDPCAAFSGCMDACTGSDCSSRCASATGANEAFCMDARCDELRDACADGDTKACADVLACAAGSETSTDSSTDDGSSSST